MTPEKSPAITFPAKDTRKLTIPVKDSILWSEITAHCNSMNMGKYHDVHISRIIRAAPEEKSIYILLITLPALAIIIHMENLKPDDFHPAVIDDLSDFKHLQKAYRSFKNKAGLLQTIMLANPFPMIVIDLEGRLVLANDSGMELFGNEFLSQNYDFLDDLIMKKFKIYRENPEVKNGETIKIPLFCYAPGNQDPAKEEKKWIESVLCPILDENNAIEYYLFMFADVSRKMNLKKENEKLRMDINEAQVTIKTLSSILQEEKQKIKSHIVCTIINDLATCLSTLRENNADTVNIIEAIETSISNITGGLYDCLVSSKYGFTAAEIRVCGFLRRGLSGKETAVELNVQYSTIHTHIKNIRRKLNLVGTGKNLQKYLMELS